MNGKIGALVTIFMMVGMAVGFNGWDDSKSYADNVKNIFSTNVINFATALLSALRILLLVIINNIPFKN